MNLRIAVGIEAADLYIAVLQLSQDHTLGAVGIALGMNTGIYSARVNLAIGRRCRIDDCVEVLARRIGVSALVNAARIAQGVMAVSGKDHGLGVLVEHRVQVAHAPGTAVLIFGPRTIYRPLGRYVGEYENGLARTFPCRLLHPVVQLLAQVGRIGVGVGGTHADGDEGVALDDFVLIQGIELTAVEDLQGILVVRGTTGVCVVVVAHRKEQFAHGIGEVSLVVEYAYQLLKLVHASGISQVAYHSQSIQAAIGGQVLQRLGHFHHGTLAHSVVKMDIANHTKGQALLGSSIHARPQQAKP